MFMEQLNEHIKRILVNANYDTSKTLSENSEMIEQRVGAQNLKNIQGAFKDLGSLRRLLNIGVDEAKLLKFMSMDAKNFESAFLKAVKQDAAAGHNLASGLGPKAKELSKIDFARRVADETASKGRQLTKAEMDAIKAATKLDNASSAGKVKIKKPVDPDTPPIDPNIPPPGPGNKKWELFKKWAKRAGYVGLTAAALYALYKYYYGSTPNELEERAKKCGYNNAEEYKKANWKCPKEGGTPKPTPVPGKWKDCENKDFQTYGCKSSYIKRVQECLGLTADGIWGKNTNDRLNNLGYGSGFANGDVDTICAKGRQTPQPTPTPGTSDRGKEGTTQLDGEAGGGSETLTTVGQAFDAYQKSLASNNTGGYDPNAMD